MYNLKDWYLNAFLNVSGIIIALAANAVNCRKVRNYLKQYLENLEL